MFASRRSGGVFNPVSSTLSALILVGPALAAMTLVPSRAAGNQNVVIVLDNSGSMAQPMRSVRRTRRIEAAKSALKAVLEQLPEDARVGLVVLNGRQNRFLIPLGPLDRSNLDSTLQGISAGGSTPLGRVMKIGADALLQARADQVYGTFKLLIVTDGEASDPRLVSRFLPDIISRGLVVDVIGVDMQSNHSLATRVQTYRRADDPESLQKAISEMVLGESTADAGDAAESDFELLTGLPDGLAVVALEALAAQGNHPIGQQPPVGGSVAPSAAIAQGEPRDVPQPGPGAGPAAAAPPAAPDTTPALPEPGGASGGMLVSVFGLFCAGVLALVILLVVGIILVGRR